MNNDSWRDAVEKIRGQADIISLVEEHTSLKRSGSRYTGCCPFHEEKTPSFYVEPRKGMYHCFGCGAGGDTFKFVMETRKLQFREAIEWMGERYGIEIPKPDNHSDQQYSEDKEAQNILRATAEWYSQVLLRSPSAEFVRNYLVERQFDPVAGFKNFGFSPDPTSLVNFLNKKNYNLALAAKYGILHRINGEYQDRYWGRLIFPIIDTSGRYVGFGARVLEGIVGAGPPKAKYVNTSETRLFQKSRLLYGLGMDRFRGQDEVIITEGYFDVLRCRQLSLNAVAPMGTALTEQQAQLINRSYKSAIIVFDGDSAGHKAMRRSIPLLVNATVRTFVLTPPQGEDIDSWFSQQSNTNISNIIDAKHPGPEYIVDQIFAAAQSVQDRQHAEQDAQEWIEQFAHKSVRHALRDYIQQRWNIEVIESNPSLPYTQPSNTSGQSKPRLDLPKSLKQLLVTAVGNSERISHILADQFLADSLPTPVLDFLQSKSEIPNELIDIKLIEISDDDWYNQLNAAIDILRRSHKKVRRAHYVQLIADAQRAGDVSRCKELERSLDQLLRE